MENRKKSIEELQAELTLEAEALATLQLIYAEKVKQVRINTLLPPDIQSRFLGEWETFYQQRMNAIFRKDYSLDISHFNVGSLEQSPSFQMLPTDTPPTPVAVMPVISAPVAPIPTPLPPSPPQMQATPTPNRAMAAPAMPNPPSVSIPTPPPMAPMAPPPMPPIKRSEPSPISTPSIEQFSNQEPALTDDILGVNTGSWMNPAESIGYEQYSDSEPISSTLMDSDKIQSSNESVNSSYDSSYDEDIDESDSIDGFAATSGLKGLTEFMDFDLKRKKS